MLVHHEEYCSASVPEIVQPDGRQPSPPQEGVKVAAQEVIGYVPALFGPRKDGRLMAAHASVGGSPSEDTPPPVGIILSDGVLFLASGYERLPPDDSLPEPAAVGEETNKVRLSKVANLSCFFAF